MGRLVLIALLMVFTHGCAQLPWNNVSQKRDKPRVVTKTKVVEMQPQHISWMAYYVKLTDMKTSQVKKEIKVNKEAYETEPLLEMRWKYIMSLLALPEKANLELANELLTQEKTKLAKEDKESYQAFKGFVVNMIDRQQSDRAKVLALEKEIKKQEENAQVLQKQLEALKAIEKNISERELGISVDGR